jgi:DNA gyrase inhibitor GyrI
MKKFLIIFGALWLFATIIIALHGGFKTVKVESIQSGPFHVLYLDHKGSYREVGKAINRVNTLLRDNSINKISLLGIYYDDPKVTPEENLRALAGALVDEKGLEAAAQLVKEGKVKQKTIKEGQFARAEFPFKNMLSMLFAIRKVYPALDKFAKDHNHPQYTYKETGHEDGYIMELYHKKKTEFFMPTGY